MNKQQKKIAKKLPVKRNNKHGDKPLKDSDLPVNEEEYEEVDEEVDEPTPIPEGLSTKNNVKERYQKHADLGNIKNISDSHVELINAYENHDYKKAAKIVKDEFGNDQPKWIKNIYDYLKRQRGETDKKPVTKKGTKKVKVPKKKPEDLSVKELETPETKPVIDPEKHAEFGEDLQASQLPQELKNSLWDKVTIMQDLVDNGEQDKQRYVDMCEEIRFILKLKPEEQKYTKTVDRLNELLDKMLALPRDKLEEYKKLQEEMAKEREKLKMHHTQTIKLKTNNLDKLDDSKYKYIDGKIKKDPDYMKKAKLFDENINLIEQADHLLRHINPKLNRDNSTNYWNLNNVISDLNMIQNNDFKGDSLEMIKKRFESLRKQMNILSNDPYTNMQSAILETLSEIVEKGEPTEDYYISKLKYNIENYYKEKIDRVDAQNSKFIKMDKMVKKAPWLKKYVDEVKSGIHNEAEEKKAAGLRRNKYEKRFKKSMSPTLSDYDEKRLRNSVLSKDPNLVDLNMANSEKKYLENEIKYKLDENLEAWKNDEKIIEKEIEKLDKEKPKGYEKDIEDKRKYLASIKDIIARNPERVAKTKSMLEETEAKIKELEKAVNDNLDKSMIKLRKQAIKKYRKEGFQPDYTPNKGEEKTVDRIVYELWLEYQKPKYDEGYEVLDDDFKEIMRKYSLDPYKYDEKFREGYVPEKPVEKPVEKPPVKKPVKKPVSRASSTERRRKADEEARRRVEEESKRKEEEKRIAAEEKKRKDEEDERRREEEVEKLKQELAEERIKYANNTGEEFERAIDAGEFNDLDYKQKCVLVRKIFGKFFDKSIHNTAFRNITKGESLTNFFNNAFAEKIGVRIKYINHSALHKTGEKLVPIDFVSEATSKKEKEKKSKSVVPVKKLPEKTDSKTLLKGPSVGNAKTFFSYDIHEIFKIIEKMLGLKLSEHGRLSIEALIFSATDSIINQHGSANKATNYDDIVDAVEKYINQHSKSDVQFHFMGQRRQQFITILKQEVRAKIDGRISALKNFV